jgi:hypothetical protein
MPTIVSIFGPRTKSASEPRLPSAHRQMLSAGAAVVNTVERAIRGQPLKASKEVQDQRWAICKACDKFRPSDNRCSLCGCFTSSWLIGKIELAGQSCPAKPPKWSAVPAVVR